MNKKIILLAIAALTILPSCLKNDTPDTYSNSCESVTLVTPGDGTEAYTTNAATYRYVAYNNEFKASLSVSGLLLGKNVTGFSTDFVDYTLGSTDKNKVEMLSFRPGLTRLDNSTSTVDNIKVCFVKGQQAYLSDENNLPHRFVILDRIYPLCSFNAGDYKVNTIIEDTYYRGVTTTTDATTPDAAPFVSEAIPYRVTLDLEKKKAVIRIYDAKFSASPREPVKTLIQIEDLDVSFSGGTYTVSGNDIVPLVPKGQTASDENILVPMAGFMFNSIKFTAVGSYLSECQLEYKVAGRYEGKFSGSYLPE